MHRSNIAQSLGFLGNIDAHRTPGDAAAASHAAAGVELIPPSAEFMPHPVPVTSANSVAFGTGNSVGELMIVKHAKARWF